MSDDERGEADETQTTSEQTTSDQGAGDDAGASSEQGGGSSGSASSGSSSSGSSDSDDDGPQLEASEPGDIGDDNLPEDLQPTEDNPLARHPEQTGDEDDTIGADREEDPETAPLRAEDADYGNREDSSGSGSGSSGGDGPSDGRAKAEEDDGSDTLDNGGGGAG